ncbi:aldehyde dehydrogenase family protein [Frankia sp. QA3]|uniref:aldehyde dehydrogenase family protein n=1 Tax=Frankia sp. QA3 TaxID=710111 RepID=UPI002100A77D|nr:aldehyde dehydrogenase family protein [Frankia sp. QA3]
MPSPYTPLSAFLVAEIAEEAGLPPGVFNVVIGTPAAGELLTSHPAVDIVSFTGSDTVGRKIVKQAADTLKKVVLELGGKSANIVCEDADPTKVIPDVVMNFTLNCGQGCSMLTRTLVHESIHDDLVAGLKGAMDHVKIGDPADPADPTVTMGPLISAAQRDKVETLIRAGLDEGAQLAYGGGRPTHPPTGFFVEPTVFVGVENSMTIAQREFFGPVTVVIPFRDDDEAVRLANDSDFGLGGGVWSGDPTRAYRIGGQIRAGMVSLNGGTGGLSPHGPFGGFSTPPTHTPQPTRTNRLGRLATTAVLIIGGGAITLGAWLGGDRPLALAMAVFYLVIGVVTFVVSGGRSDVAALMRVAGDERQRSLDLRATALSALAMETF